MKRESPQEGGPASHRHHALVDQKSISSRRRVARTAGTPYGTAALNAALEDLAEAPERHPALYRISAAMGNLLASGQLYEESYVTRVLFDTAMRRGMTGREREAERTILDGISAGRTTPRFPVSRAPLYNRNDATVATIMWLEAVEKAPWTTRSSANDLRVLAAFGILSLRQGKVRFSASYRQISEEAGVSVGTVHAALKRGLKGFVRRVHRGDRFQAISATWQLIPRHALPEQGLCPEEASIVFSKRVSAARPDHDYWNEWPNSWRIFCLLSGDEGLSAREVSEKTGRHIETVRRNLNRLRDRQLAKRGADGLWTALPPPEGAIDGGLHPSSSRANAPRTEKALGKVALGSDRKKGRPMSAKWQNQPDLFSYPKSRWNNPSTSREAAESIGLERVSDMQQKILTILRFHGPMSDETLVEHYLNFWPDSASDQGIRSRRGELVRKGRVVDSGRRGTTKYGRSCVVWKVAS